MVTETAVQAQAHEIKEDWKPSFLSNDEFMHLMLEVLFYITYSHTKSSLGLLAHNVVTRDLHAGFFSVHLLFFVFPRTEMSDSHWFKYDI